MADGPQELLSRLETMDLRQLRDAWAERYGYSPKTKSVALLRLNLAWRLQEAASGGLDADVRLKLRQSSQFVAKAASLEQGTRLTREWQGVQHEVIVAEDGYLYAGRTWKSLSQIAREITGVRWNGPRFFGLRQEAA